MRTFVMALIVAGGLALCVQPAQAAVTASIAISGPANYTGTCPVTIGFSGTISGTPGTQVTYSWNRFINGAQQIGTGATITLSAAPSPVTDSIKISSNASGTTFDQLWVHNISGGLPDVYSNKIAFSVMCVIAPTPTPDAPTGLTNTTSQTTCAAHGGIAGLFCPDALHGGYLVLIWNAPTFGPTPSGYHVYETDSGQHTQVDDQKNGQLTISFQKPPSNGFAGRCYVVTAYANGVDSAPSNQFCMPSRYSIAPPALGQNTNPNMYTTNLYKWSYRVNDYKCFGCLGGEYGLACQSPCVGWETYKTGDGPSLNHEITVWRSYLAFNWTISLHNLNVYKATVTLVMAPGSNPSCFGGIAPASAEWIGNNDWVQGDFSYNEPHTVNGTIFSIDVTSIVRDWASGKVRNFGFVMAGSNETGSEPDNASCNLNFNPSPSLSVEHY